MPRKEQLKELLKQLKEHSEKNEDYELKDLCKKFDKEISAMDAMGGDEGGNSPESNPDIP